MRQSVVHGSLHRKRVIMGVDARVFGLEAAWLGVCVTVQMWSLLGIAALVHLLARWAHVRDAQLVEASVRYSREADVWDPWHHRPVVAARPPGFGRGLPR